MRSRELCIGPLSSVDDAFVWDEGEGDRMRDWWIDAHLSYMEALMRTWVSTSMSTSNWSSSDSTWYGRHPSRTERAQRGVCGWLFERLRTPAEEGHLPSLSRRRLGAQPRGSAPPCALGRKEDGLASSNHNKKGFVLRVGDCSHLVGYPMASMALANTPAL
jgi:hypothetical protein